ncbi:hypothetical protein ACTRG8_002439 [Enterococcus faecalis]|nr:hypothetical protein [Enterococcus faecalis]
MFSFEEVLFELDNVISLKTLKNWANRVERLTDTKFVRQHAKNRNGGNYSYKVFSFNQIEQFKQLVNLREKNIPLEEAIISVFLSDEEKQNREVISIAKKQFEENLFDTKELLEFTKEILEENAEMKKRLKVLEMKVGVL